MYGGLDLLIMCRAGNSTWAQSIVGDLGADLPARVLCREAKLWDTHEPFSSGDLPLSFNQFVSEHQSRPPTAGEYRRSKGPTVFPFYVEVGPYLALFDISALCSIAGELDEKSINTPLDTRAQTAARVRPERITQRNRGAFSQQSRCFPLSKK
jgi:hypothetical protein